MDFSKYKLQKYLTETSAMGSVKVGNDTVAHAKEYPQVSTTRERAGVQSRQSATKPRGNREMAKTQLMQGHTPDYDQYFTEMNAEKDRQRQYNEQKSDWRQELIQEKAIDGVEREQHPFVTVMPTGDENMIQAMKQMAGEVKEKGSKVKAGLQGGGAMQSEQAEVHDDKMRDKADFEFKKNPGQQNKRLLGDIKKALEEAKKSDCKDGYKWDSEKKKCVKKTGSSSTRVYVGGWGHHHHHDDDDKDDGDNGGGDSGGDSGGDGGVGEMFDFLGDLLLQEKEMSVADQLALSRKAFAERDKKGRNPNARKEQRLAQLKSMRNNDIRTPREKETQGRYK